MGRIIRVIGREIIDSRGNPTVEAEVRTEEGHVGRAAVPSGTSTGSLEAAELRDNDITRFGGKGVKQAVAGINTEICAKLISYEVTEQRIIDQCLIQLDGTPNKVRLGANALLAVSLAAAKAAAHSRNEPLYHYLNRNVDDMCLPTPLINILNGGAHASASTDFQEFMVVPVGVRDICEAIRAGAEIFHSLKTVLENRGYTTTVGDEGGFAPNLNSNETAIELLLEAIAQSGYAAGKEICLALDVAATELWLEQGYWLKSEKRMMTGAELIKLYQSWIQQYPIISIEDGLAENDWQGWQKMTRQIGDQTQLVGDDLFVTNTLQIEQGIRMGVANSVLIKPNQIGTLSETMDAIQKAQSAGYSCIISHRSGETEDTTIADLAVATGVGQIKTGSLSRSDRVAKYNQLLRIHEKLGVKSCYAGNSTFRSFVPG